VRPEPRLSRLLHLDRTLAPKGEDRIGNLERENKGMNNEEGYLMTQDGLRLHYKKVGCGPAVLIPNGLYLFDDFNQRADQRTLIFYDLRNRGLSDTVTDRRKLELGLLNDVHDLDTVRRHFDLCDVDLLGHSYMGPMIVLYAMNYGQYVRRLILIGCDAASGRDAIPVASDWRRQHSNRGACPTGPTAAEPRISRS
jgi:pimeloyl-ACP methyl ester carboxylesterase